MNAPNSFYTKVQNELLIIAMKTLKHWALIALPLALSPLSASAQSTLTIVTDNTWEISAQPIYFGEFPMSAEQVSVPTLHGGTYQAVAAEYNQLAKVIPGSTPIWRNRTSTGEREAYQFRKTVALGAAPIRKVTLEVNSDDVSRVYINQRLASSERDGKLKDGWDDWYLFRSVSGFTYNRVYTYDVTDYFFTNVTNTIFVEAGSLAFDAGHAYFSAKFVFEFDPVPPPRPAPVKRPAAAKPKAATTPPVSTTLPAPKNIVFEAGSIPEIDQLKVGSLLELGQVYFKTNDYQLDSSSNKTLSALAAFMKRHPSLKIEVGGHTNLLPTDQFAAELSTNRARAVVQFLTDNGVPAERLSHKGYGKTQPRVKGTSKEANRSNQRVEVKVLGK